MKISISSIYDDGRRTITIGPVKLPWPFPIAWGLHGSSARVLGWPVFGDAPAYIKHLHRAFRIMKDGQYWLKYRLIRKHQYHIIRSGLKPGYYDVDTVMLNGCMELLRRYVEDEHEHGLADVEAYAAEFAKEGSEGFGPRENVDHHVNVHLSAAAIYKWWTIQRPADIAHREELMHRLYGGRSLLWEEPEEPGLAEKGYRVLKPLEFTPEEESLKDEYRALEKKIEDDEQTMLHALIDIRQSLWT